MGSATAGPIIVGGAAGGSPGTSHQYAVWVGDHVLDRLSELVSRGRRVLVVAQGGGDGPRAGLYAQVCAAVENAGGQAHLAVVPDAEAAKDVTVLARLWEQMGMAEFTRNDLVVGLGGGAVTDLAGFAAATWLRGVDVVQLPTSLLGVVDAAVGGKTGINTAQGKNLVGAFYPPQAVLCDPVWLRTMARGDYVSGLAEVIKCGFIADPVILALIEQDPAAATSAEASVTGELITRSVQVKAEVVSADLTESSVREILNFGHTFGHAIEQVEDYRWRHGDAVAVGMIFAAELGALVGRTPPEVVRRLRAMLISVGLPTTYRPDRWVTLRTAMARDKKARGSELRFVVVDAVGTPGRLDGPSEESLLQAYAAVAG